MIVDKNAKSLEESVFLKLQDEILSGTLVRGETLTEASITSRLGTSRTPVRAALARLAEEGLVELSPNRGAVVLGVTSEDLVDIYKMRMRLEGLASREAAKKISDEDKKLLTDSVELSEFYIRKKDAEKLKELDSEFHDIIYRASGNRALNKTLSELHRNITAYRKMSLAAPGRLERSVGEHREILEAIEAHDAEMADRLTSEHIAAALENMLITVEKQEGI